MSAGPAIALRGACVDYGGPSVLVDVDLTVERGAIAVLLGESGTGKTTLLRAIAGFEPLSAGTLELFGETVAAPGQTPTPPERRHVGVVFQDYALFPHLDVGGNLAFGMKKRDDDRIDELLKVVGLDGYRVRPVSALSGGEQQRVALARSLAHSPRLILFDEPFSNLNRGLRRALRRQTIDVLREREITAVFVTHDREEAFAVATTLSVMDGGHVLQTGEPRELYEHPASASVASAVGDCAIVEGTLVDGRFESALGAVETIGAGGDAVVVRPEHLEIVDGADAAPGDRADAALDARVERVEFGGHADQLELSVGPHRLIATAPTGRYRVGAEVGVRVVSALPLV